MPVGNRPAEPALLQRLISETLWQIRRATNDRDQLAARAAEREMAALLDRLADCMITDGAGSGVAAPALRAPARIPRRCG